MVSQSELSDLSHCHWLCRSRPVRRLRLPDGPPPQTREEKARARANYAAYVRAPAPFGEDPVIPFHIQHVADDHIPVDPKRRSSAADYNLMMKQRHMQEETHHFKGGVQDEHLAYADHMAHMANVVDNTSSADDEMFGRQGHLGGIHRDLNLDHFHGSLVEEEAGAELSVQHRKEAQFSRKGHADHLNAGLSFFDPEADAMEARQLAAHRAKYAQRNDDHLRTIDGMWTTDGHEEALQPKGVRQGRANLDHFSGDRLDSVASGHELLDQGIFAMDGTPLQRSFDTASSEKRSHDHFGGHAAPMVDADDVGAHDSGADGSIWNACGHTDGGDRFKSVQARMNKASHFALG